MLAPRLSQLPSGILNRMAKLKQMLSDSAVHVELAIRYWANKPEDFHQFGTIVLNACTTYEEAWVFEHLLISKWQAPLNFPFITEFLKLKAKGWQLQYWKHNRKFPRIPLGDRLCQRVRRKLQTLNAPLTEFSFQTTAWEVLYQLTSPGRIAFETAASLFQTGWTFGRTVAISSPSQNETSFQCFEI